MHHDHLILIGGDNPGGGGVGGDPALPLADVQQYAVNALLGGRARIEVVGEDLVEIAVAAVDHHLLAIEVGVAEGGRHIDNGAGLEVLHLPGVHKGLELRQGEGEKGRVSGADQNGVVAVLVAAGLEGHNNQFLLGQPAVGFLPELVKVIAVHILKPGLVGGLVISDAHTVGVPTAHVVLHIVDHCAVFASDHGSLLHRLSVHIVEDLNLVRVLVAEDELIEGLLAVRHDHTGAIVDNIGQFRRKREFFQQNIHGNGASLSFRLGLSIETKNTSICNFTGESCFCQGEGGLPFQRPPPLPAGSPAVFFLQSVRAQASCRYSPKKTKTPPMDSHGRHFVHSVKKRVTGALYIR